MNALFSWAENLICGFSFWDMGILKICLFSIGLIFGAYFSDFVKKWIWWVATIAILSLFWMIYLMIS